jgi:CRP-like cAMP-binding protein
MMFESRANRSPALMAESPRASRRFPGERVIDALHPHTRWLIAKMASITSLSEEEKAVLSRLPMAVIDLRTDQDIVREGDRPTRSCLLVAGYACRSKATLKGRRQILSFHIPGEIPDLQSLYLTTMDHTLQTITPCRVGFIPHEALRDLCARQPRIAGALWRETRINAAIFREWMIGIGRRSAHARIAHFLCEFLVRMQAVGLAEDHACELPFTQAEIGNALGLSTVHVNRTLQELRGAGLITLRRGALTVTDWDGLTEAGEFDPTYLHHERGAA